MAIEPFVPPIPLFTKMWRDCSREEKFDRLERLSPEAAQALERLMDLAWTRYLAGDRWPEPS